MVVIDGKEYFQADLVCPDCSAKMALRPSRFGLFYGCTNYPQCRGTHGAHSDGKPLGTPANSEVKRLRIQTHALFDELWKSGEMTRNQAYSWLKDALNLTEDEAHIGKFDKDQCERLINFLNATRSTTK